MLIMTDEFDMFNRHYRIFKNGTQTYEILLVYRPSNENLTDIDIANHMEFHISCTPLKEDGLNIRIPTIHNEETDKEVSPFEIMISRFLQEHRYFGEMENQTGDWADACRTVIEIDEKLRELHPGYFITNKRTY